MILYRPVGLEELALIYDSGMKAFPTRLPKQPIFYPVLDLEYARKTASKWNVKNGQFAGYVAEFRVEDEYINKYEKHTVGKSQHQEFWIPAEDVEEFNKYIVGHIKVVEAYFGDGFQGFVPDEFGLQGKNAVEQFTLLSNSYLYKRMDFYLEIKRNHKAVFLNYPFWQIYDFKNPGLKEKILQAIREAWFTSFPKIPLVPPVHEDTKPEHPTDSQTSVDPADEDGPRIRPGDPKSSAKPAHEDVPPTKQRNSYSPVKPVGEPVKPPKQRDSQFSIRPIRKDVVPVKQKDSYSSVEPVHEDTAPAKQADSLALAETPYENTAPVEPAHSQIENPVHADSDLTQQTDSHLVLGVRSGLSGKYDEAIEELSAAVEEDPASAVAHTSLGVALHRAEQDDRALASYEAALTINPQYAEAYYFRANILYERGDIRGAIAGYTMAVGLDPELVEAHRKPVPQDRLTDYTGSPAEMYWIARSAHRILDLNKSLEQNPRQANLLKERAAQYYRLWNYEQTIADYSASLKIQPDDANALHLRGLAYEQMGQQGRALEDYQQAIHLNPQLSDLYINRGVTFGKMGNLRQSISSLSEGIRLAPKNPDGYFNRGVTYFQGGDFERAVDDFSSVILLSPNDDAAYYWRGVSNEEAGRQREAIADYKQFLKLSQDPGAKAEIEQRLSQWNEAPQNRVSRQGAAPNDRQRTIQVESKKSEHKPDLYDLIAALGERALNSIWFGAGVNCSGEKAEELYASTDHNRPIQGRDLLQITSGIQQTIEGDFTGFDPDATSHWIFIRAWQGNGFYVETNDPTSKQRLKGRFPSAEDVTDVEHPYEGLFISI